MCQGTLALGTEIISAMGAVSTGQFHLMVLWYNLLKWQIER